MVRAGDATARRFNGGLLFSTALLWACYVLSLVPSPAGSELMAGLLRGCFVSALIWSTITGVLALYGALRYRYRGYLVTAALVVPLALLCWYHAFSWSVPGTGRFSPRTAVLFRPPIVRQEVQT
jgi:hypothetical protein